MNHNIKKLEKFLKKKLPHVSGNLVLEKFSGGYSNLTYLLRFNTQEFVLRRPPLGVSSGISHDVGREFYILSCLSKVYSGVPRPILFCDDLAIIDAPFFIMEYMKGIILRNKVPPGLRLTAEVMEGLSIAFIDKLVEFHTINYQATGLATLGRPQGYIERQIKGWNRQYKLARTDSIPEIEEVAQWLLKNMHSKNENENEYALLHNDYKLDNLVLNSVDPGQIISVLDWEMGTIGDPLLDLGTSLGYWIEANDPDILKSFGLTTLPGSFDRKQLLDRYEEKRNISVKNPVFYYVYGIFKILVITQQLYQRYHRGYASDSRLSNLIYVVRILAHQAILAIEKNRIHNLY